MGYTDRYEDDYDSERRYKRRRLSPPAVQAPQTLRLVAKPSSRSPLDPDQYLARLFAFDVLI